MQKLAVNSECLLFPKADVQFTRNWVKLGSAYGHKRTVVPVNQLGSKGIDCAEIQCLVFNADLIVFLDTIIVAVEFER